MKKLILAAVVTGMILVQGCVDEEEIDRRAEANVQEFKTQVEEETANFQEYNAQIREEIKLQAEARQRNRAVTARNKAKAKPEHDKCSAYTMAQDFVTSRLKCPSTAKWPGIWAGVSYSKVTFHLGNGRYQISSYLDAQNGFGAMVRVNFICVVEHVSGSNWRLVRLVM